MTDVVDDIEDVRTLDGLVHWVLQDGNEDQHMWHFAIQVIE